MQRKRKPLRAKQEHAVMRRTPSRARRRGARSGSGGATRTRGFLARLGPGVVTGAADDDPSGIGTYSQVGAQFGFSMLWTIVFSLPLMCAVQEICGRIGRVTGKGLAANLLVYPRWLVGGLIVLLLCANTINIGADLAAMGAAMHLIAPGPPLAWSLAFALLCVVLEVFVRYERYARWLKWLCLSIFAYVAAALAVDIPWTQALKATLLPHLTLSGDYLLGLTAVLGTTISPYLFFWQAAQEVEEIKAVSEDKALRDAPQQAADQLARIRIDTFVGMAASALVAYFIILMCAATLHTKGVTQIGTAAQAAEALRPIAGRFAFVLFACGLVGSGLLAVPVLAGSAAFGVAELAGWKAGLERPARRAKRFYAVIAVATLVGVGMTFLGLDPIKALFWSAVINAAAAVPILVLIMLVANKREIMGRFKLPRWLLAGGWLTCAIMALVAIAAFVSIGRG